MTVSPEQLAPDLLGAANARAGAGIDENTGAGEVGAGAEDASAENETGPEAEAGAKDVIRGCLSAASAVDRKRSLPVEHSVVTAKMKIATWTLTRP